jgi:hypothetical protein
VKNQPKLMKIVYKAVLLLFIFFLVSCKKDKKTNPAPVITVSLPSSGQSFGYLLDPTLKTYTTTINVSAQVSDNERLTSISVALVDGNYVQQQASVNVPISSADFVFNINYEVTQFRLQSGTYYIQITASDGTNTVVAYQPIYIYASPAQLWGYCVVLKSNNRLISYYDTSGNLSHSFPMLGVGYNGMKYGGYNQQLYVNGSGNGTQQLFQAYSMQPQSLGAVSYTENSPSNEYYTCLYTDGNKPYVGYYSLTNAIVYSYLNGATSTSFGFPSTAPYGYPYYFTTTSLYGVAAFKNKAGAGNFDNLTTFHNCSGGAFISSINFPLNFKAVAIFEKQQDSLYVFGNDTSTNTAALYIYQPMENLFSPSSLISSGSGKMLSAVKVTNQCIIFSTNTGIYVCNGLSINPAPSPLSSGAQKLSYQTNINNINVLTVGSGSSIAAYAVGSTTVSVTTFSFTLIKTLSLGNDSLIDFEVITNK